MTNLRPTIVADLMSRKLVTLFETDALEIIEGGMQRYRFRHLPVVDAQGRLVGLVTQRDLLRVSASSLEPGATERTRELWALRRVADIMTREVTVVASDLLLVEAGRLMRDKKLGCLPVTDDAGLLLGLVTEADFVGLAIELLERWA
jgi:CBS domain-containing protein